MPTQSVGTIKWLRGQASLQQVMAFLLMAAMLIDGSHALRGNPALDAPRPVFDAERRGLHAHAERGYDQFL
jgi:hypothetical protein